MFEMLLQGAVHALHLSLDVLQFLVHAHEQFVLLALTTAILAVALVIRLVVRVTVLGFGL